MPSSYLSQLDIVDYGVPNATPAQINYASALIDQYLGRTKGCVWVPDALGNPAYMKNADIIFTFTSTASITAGSDVVVQYTGGVLSLNDIGEVLILDRAFPTLTEACVIKNVSGNMVTLETVLFDHISGVTMDYGMLLGEEHPLPKNRSLTRFAQFPLVRLASMCGRYAYGRRTDQTSGVYAEFNLLATIQSFGGPPQWIPVDTTQASISNQIREIWVPAGILLSYYSDIKFRYVAGWSASNLPSAIKQACANLILAVGDTPGSPNIKSWSDRNVGISVQQFSQSRLDPDTKQLLEPYKVMVLA